MKKVFKSIVLVGGAALAVLAISPARAASTGFNQTGAGPYDYNTAANWVGNTINGLWDTSLTLASTQTNTFASDTVLGTGLTFNYLGNYAMRLEAAAPGTNTITLGGNLSMLPGSGSAAVVTIGDNTNHLNINLGGVTRTINVGTNSMVLQDVIANGAITKIGSGTLNLSGNNNYDGVTTISNGIVTVVNSNGLGSTNGNTLLYCTGATTNGAVIYFANNVTCPEAITINGTTEALQYNNAITTLGNCTSILSGPITLSGTSTLRIGEGANSTITFNGPIARDSVNVGQLSLRTQSGSTINVNGPINLNGGALNIVGNNTALGVATLGTNGNSVGAAQISGSAILRLGANNALATNQNLTLGVAGTSTLGQDIGCLDLAGHDQSVNALAGYPNTSSNIGPDSSRYVTNSAAAGTNTLTVGNGGSSATFKGVIVDGANAKVALTKTGTGGETLNSPCTYTGPTIINGGSINLGANSSLSANTTVFINSNATFDVTALTTASATYLFTPASLTASGLGNTSHAQISGTAGGTVNLTNKPVTLVWSGASSGTNNGMYPLLVSGVALNLSSNQFTVVVPDAGLMVGQYQLIYDGSGITGSVNSTPLYTGGSGVAPGYTGHISFGGTNNIYLIVTANTYSVSYNGNGSTGGSVPSDSGAYTNGATVTVLANTGNLTRTGYTFGGWNTAANGTGTAYAASGSAPLTMGLTNVTLYAQWTQATVSPAHLTNSIANGNQLVLSWPNGSGWLLLAQTDSLATGLNTNNWVTNTGATSPFTNTIDTAQPTVFYRLYHP